MKESEPIGRFGDEYARATASEPFDAARCALATADAGGGPSVRFVLLKAFDERGFVVFTNFGSQKARDIQENPRAALAFHWHTTGVQVRVRGVVTRVSSDEADAYFATRDRGSQIGAWASKQSELLRDRATLESEVAVVQKRFEHVSVVRPPYWGGFRISAEAIEFWHNREDRLHERWLYKRVDDRWSCTLLYP